MGADMSPWADADRIALGRTPGGGVVAIALDRDRERGRRPLTTAELPAWVAERESEAAASGRGVRWVWSSTAAWYPALLAAGVRVGRCHDLRLCHAILRDAVPGAAELRAATAWDAPDDATADRAEALFDLEAGPSAPPRDDLREIVAELARQDDAAARAADPGRMRLLLAAESAGALVACEMRVAGVPWDAEHHAAILADVLGPRRVGGVPERMARLAAEVREALDDPTVSIDSPPRLLKSLHDAGILVESTSKWELGQIDHPAIPPLLEYKRLARLLTANGWAWLDEWVHDGRFRPVYVPGGVVTGRWASSGGGALQLPRQLRGALRADPGWRIVGADVAQLEPRVLAAMARDERMADAARGRDLYEGIVASGAVATRAEAKIAVLGAMYGATTGDSGRLVPRLRKVFPRAMGLVDAAARTGEEGGVVATWLGRTSPPPEAAWRAAQERASGPAASAADESRARRIARDRGRFTRNFVVQGTAAEWALAWLADLRLRLAQLPPVATDRAAPRSGPAFARRAHIAFFLHDEVLVHAPAEQAEEAAEAMRASAASAGRLLFGTFPVDFRLDLRISGSAAKD
ncbi:bifunctional 3'-5' exonuclease/DNA polymerase [Microbacterium sp. MEC084]|uniref:bifunctional 3'-5' exonuclease/DNA polymerase n=1 Tax=Microbacterium sp. MEC084 TaxID=1963027 RepID=UPI00110504EB|nr:bifunctional 3'-5' exonuclease/DNA polymerase [Microbacterium sp. MEC084]MCD1267260.1 bifunctional 3'-5' exonuclease/DNA polymerase [Microbacterium sp. MEC084]